MSCHLPIVRKELEFVSNFSKLKQENKRQEFSQDWPHDGLPFLVTGQYGSNESWTNDSRVKINFPFG